MLHPYEHYADASNADVWAVQLAPFMQLPMMKDVIAKAKSAFHAAVRSMTCLP